MPKAYILINTEPDVEEEFIEEVNKLDGIVEVASVYGKYDFIVIVKSDTMEKVKDIAVSLNTHLTNELINEGTVRDLIRKVQNSRKELGFEVEDRIVIDINCSEKFYHALNDNLDYFKNETLCVNLNILDSINIGNIEKININSETIQL